jgi:hypothetical protein
LLFFNRVIDHRPALDLRAKLVQASEPRERILMADALGVRCGFIVGRTFWVGDPVKKVV